MDTFATIPANTSDFGRKDVSMKRIFAIALFAFTLAFSAAIANTYLAIDDSGVDYENTKLKKAYVGFDMIDGKLVVIIDDSQFEGSLPAIEFVVHDLEDRTDFWGDTHNADITDITEVRWTGVNDDLPQADYLVGFRINHKSTPLSAALAAYEQAFGDLGFDMQVRDTVVDSLKLVTFTNGDTMLAGRFYGHTNDVDVTLASN